MYNFYLGFILIGNCFIQRSCQNVRFLLFPVQLRRNSFPIYIIKKLIIRGDMMIYAYSINEENIVHLIENHKSYKADWLHLTDPSETELENLAAEYKFPIDFLNSAFDPDEVARYENLEELKEGLWNLVILLFPIKTKDKNGYLEYITRPLSIIVSEKLLITASLELPYYLKDIMNNQLVHSIDITNHVQFILHVAMSISNDYIHYLKEINKATEQLEENISESSESAQLLKLMKLQKSLVFFSAAIDTNHPVISKLQETDYFIRKNTSKKLLRDVRVQNKQAENMIHQTLQLLHQISNTFSSVISNNLNNTLKFLASITIVMTIPSLIGALWGMNVPVPWQRSPAGFFITVFIIILVSLLTTYWLKKKKFF